MISRVDSILSSEPCLRGQDGPGMQIDLGDLMIVQILACRTCVGMSQSSKDTMTLTIDVAIKS